MTSRSLRCLLTLMSLGIAGVADAPAEAQRQMENLRRGVAALNGGDWREEVISAKADGQALRIYMSTYPIEIRMPTLMHDPQYRAAIAWRNVAYNLPPWPSFFIGHDMKPPVRTPITVAR